MKKILSALGTAGYILYYLIGIVFCVLPIVAIDFSTPITIILVILSLTFSEIFTLLVDPVLWVWGLITVINSSGGTFAIVYYISFGIFALFFLFNIVTAIVGTVKR